MPNAAAIMISTGSSNDACTSKRSQYLIQKYGVKAKQTIASMEVMLPEMSRPAAVKRAAVMSGTLGNPLATTIERTRTAAAPACCL